MKSYYAKVAQLVEHDLAKVGVASSNLVFRSKKRRLAPFLLFGCEPNGRPGGGIGRHVGLKIQWALARAGSSPAPGTENRVSVKSESDEHSLFFALNFFTPTYSP